MHADVDDRRNGANGSSGREQRRPGNVRDVDVHLWNLGAAQRDRDGMPTRVTGFIRRCKMIVFGAPRFGFL